MYIITEEKLLSIRKFVSNFILNNPDDLSVDSIAVLGILKVFNIEFNETTEPEILKIFTAYVAFSDDYLKIN